MAFFKSNRYQWSENMNKAIMKYAYIFISMAMAIVIMLSSRSLLIKIVIIILQIPVNRMLDRYFFDKFYKNIKIIKLKKLNFLGLNPKIEILIDIYVFCFVYILFSIYILGYDVSFISSKVAKVILILPIILVIIDSLYSKHIDVRKQQDGTIVYGVSYNDNENSSIFGLRVGKFDKGIVIDDYIFYDEEIYFTTYSQDFEFIFILKDESKIIIRDKRAVRFFKDMVKDKYDFDWDVRYVKFDDLDEFADSLFEVLKDQEYIEAVNAIGDKILKRVTEGKKFSEIGASFNDFILLEAAYDLQSTDKDKISNYIANKYGHFFVASNEELAAASICLFNTLFGYLHDDLLDNENAFTSEDNTGFDYSALDFSTFNVSYLKPDNGPIDSHKETYMGASKRLAAIQSKIQKNTESLNAVKLSGNTKAQAVLSANLNNDKILEATMISDVASAKATYDDAVDYVTDNSLLVYNRGIINGIRNSIAHGKYTVIQSGSFDDVRILFEDIYEGETTFKADISIADFLNFIYSSEAKVVSFVKSKKKVNEVSI